MADRAKFLDFLDMIDGGGAGQRGISLKVAVYLACWQTLCRSIRMVLRTQHGAERGMRFTVVYLVIAQIYKRCRSSINAFCCTSRCKWSEANSNGGFYACCTN